jgi:hypothetical protein
MTLLRFERDLALQREKLEMRTEERKRRARMQERAFDLEIEREKEKIFSGKKSRRKSLEMREMRENEDIDDYLLQ